MKKYILILTTMVSSMAYANGIEVNGQFVVAPIASEECNAAAITQPTFGISAESDLISMLTFFLNENGSATSINEASMPNAERDDIAAIYSLNGQKQNELKRGINIVVDSHGAARKILVK